MKIFNKAEKFKLLGFLGSGAFAQTHLAEVLDPKLRNEWGGKVVIKIPLNKEKEEVLINELIMNASLHLNLQNAKAVNIVRYLGYSKYEEFFVMVMEYVEGTDLRKILGPIGEQKAQAIDETLNIAEQICKGLIEIHKFHIFHRDLKPENTLVCNENNIVKIMDFGIARFLSSEELASTTAGTIYYMPKEILDGEGGAFYSDIYSIGVIMYEMLTGELPFTGRGLGEVVKNICYQSPKPPMEINPQIDERINKIILRAIEKEPERRYSSAEDLFNAIRLYREGKDEDTEQIEKCVAEVQELFDAGKFKEAEKKLKGLVKNYPENPKSYLGLGEFYNRCQRYQDALKIFKKGIEVDPDFAMLYRDMGLSLSAIGSKREAIDTIKKAIELGLEESLEKHAIKLLELWERGVV